MEKKLRKGFFIEQLALKSFCHYLLSSSYFFSGSSECFYLNLPSEKVINFIDKEISSQASHKWVEGSETTGELESS